MKKQRYTDEELENAVKHSFSYLQVLKSLNISGGHHRTIKKRINELHMNVSHFTGQSWSKGKTAFDDDRIIGPNKDRVFCQNSDAGPAYIRKIIKKKNILQYRCVVCENMGDWQGKKLVLQLYHINGIRNDHRLENLRWMCPNCHAQTETYGGANQRKVAKPESEIIDAIKSSKNIRQVLIKVDLDNGRNYSRIKRIMRENNLAFPRLVAKD